MEAEKLVVTSAAELPLAAPESNLGSETLLVSASVRVVELLPWAVELKALSALELETVLTVHPMWVLT